MTTKVLSLFNLNRRGSGASLNRTAMRVALIGLFISLGIGQAWAGDPTYKTDFKATGGATGKGYVYAGTSDTATPVYVETSDDIAESNDTKSATGTNKYYAWAKAVRGSEFQNWSISGSNGGVSPTSSTNNRVTVTVTSNKENGTNTGTATATWTTYAEVNVTYNPSEDGVYSVTYQYNSYDATTQEFTTGDAENLSRTISSENGAQTIGSYNNDVITLKSTSGTFQGWYSDAGFTSQLSTDNPYTYTAPTSGSAAVYPKYEHVDKYYGRLTASIAAVPYSMPGGGTIFISKEEAGTGTYSADAQTVDNVGMGTTGLKYYLHAHPTDKRYVFRGWYSNPECAGTALSTNADYTYTFTATSMNSASPSTGNVYAAFDFNLFYMQVELEPAVPGLGMVLVKDNNTGTPVYTEYTTHSEQFLYAYRLAPTANAYLYAKPKYGYKFSGWYDNPDCTGTVKSTANPYTYAATGSSTDPMNPTIIKLYAKFVEDASTVNITYNRPDQTKGEYTASVLDIAEVDDDFIWTFTQVFTSEGKTGNTTQAQHKTDVLRLEAQPKAGYGVTSWTIAGAAKTTPSQLYETTGTAAATYGVTFGDAKPFLVSTNSTQYATLREALTAVGNSGKITVVQNAYVEAGNYTIPSGVTLLVPYESTGKSYTSPSTSYEKAQNFASATQYVLLTIGSGANIYLAGSIIVMADLCAPNGGGFGSGAPLSAYGRIAMSENSTITVNSGANLYCWGYITGIEGLVTAKSGAKIHEIFQHQNNPGGSAATGWNEDAFFLNQYYVQNIESPLKIEYGASETVYAQMSVPSGSINNLSATLIDKDNTGMFALTSSGSYLIRTYSPSTDRITYDIYGNAKLNYISMSVYGMDLNTSKYVLPITSNMSVKCHPINGASSTFIVQYAVSFIPGAELIVDEGVTLNAQNKLIIYDREEWIDKGFAQFNLHSGGSNWSRSSFTPTRTYTRVKADLVDAKVDLNGTMNVSGSLYTTNSGADIISSNGTGVVKLLAAAPNNSNDIQYSSNKLGTSIKVPMTPAQLRNGDDSYTLTAGAVANDQFIYSKSQEKWLKNPKVVSWNANGGTTEASTMAYSQGSFVGELPAAYKDGYTLEGWYTAADGGTQIAPSTKVTANVTYYAHWTPKSYTITYRDNGGTAFSGTHVDSPTAHPTTHTFGTATTLNGVNNKTGYTFGGWYRTPSCSGTVVTSITASECKNITLYAKWIPNTHKLTWDWNGGATSSTTYTAAGDAVAYNTTIVYPADNTLTKANFVFNGWDKSITTMPDEDLTITAQWAPAVASVTAGSTTTYYTTFVDALTYAKTQATATITILEDIDETSTALTYNKASGNCTLDLNGHTVNLTITGSGTTGVNMIKIDASGSTFTITDNSAEKDGKLILKQGITTATATKRWYGIVLANGSLALNAGEVQAINDFTYTSTKNTGMISAIYIAAGKTFTMNGGSIYAESPYYPRAIEIAGSASANATVTLNAGTITANATAQTNAMGIYTLGGTTTIKDGVTINATTKTTTAYGIYVDASTSNYWGTVNIIGGTINATATTKTAHGIYVGCAMVSNKTTPNTFGATYSAVANISGGTFNVSTLSAETATGVTSRGTTTISGGTFNVTPKTSSAYGVSVQHGTTTINGNPVFDIKATATATGILVATIPADKTGQPMNGNAIVNGGTFDVETTSTTDAYGVYVNAIQRVITSTSSGYYPGTYYSIGTATINGGTFNVTAKTYTAIGVYVARLPIYEAGTNNATIHRASATINGGTFTVRDLTHKTTTGACDGVRSYGTLNITGGTFDVAASAATAKNATYVYGVNVYDGTATVSGTPEFTVSAYGTAFGAVANGATPDKATGLPCEADLTIDGGTFNVNTTTSTTAYGVYAAGPAPRVITSTAAGYYPGTYYSKPVATVNDGTFNVKAKTTTAIGAYCGRGVLYDQEVLEPHTVELENFGELNIKGGTFNVSTLGTTTADGVRSFGTTNITGGTFNVTPKTTTATAIRTYAGKTTITGNPHFTVKGTTTVYGLNAGCEAPNSKSGLTYNGEIECNGGTFDLETTTDATCYGVYAFAGSVKITTLHSANADYFAGNYASAGTIVVNDGIFNVKAKTTGAYGVVVPAAVSQSGATGYPTATATAKCDINGGKFIVEGTETFAVYKKAATADFKISGGYWGGDGVNDNLAYYAVSPNKVLTLREVHALYADGYRYTIGEGGTVTWKNGDETLKTEMYESGETPAYSGATPTKAEDAEYTYTHNGWDPTVEAMANADQTYTATFNHIEKKYTVNVAAGANGSASPASVSGIGCVTASGNITATPNTGYRFANWTLPTGVTAADGYTSESNPIHIHATASGKTITANFAAKTYTVTLDNQSATTAGAASVTATYNEAMPSIAANLPARTGYAFGGYFTETNGGGTQYYNADGTSAHIWDIDAASPTLYAKWTASIVDRELDIVDWTSNSITINVTNLKAVGGTNKNNWAIRVNDTDYPRKTTTFNADRTLTISGLSLTPNDNLLIQLKNDAGVIESQHNYTIPFIYASTVSLSEETTSSSVVYVYGGKLTISDNTELAALYVCPGAEVEVTGGNTLTVGKLVLRTKPWATAAISGNVSATNVYYTRIAPDGSSEYPTGKYYQFGLPYECAISDVRLSDGTTPAYNTTWILKSYNEEKRATNGANGENWDVLEGDKSIAAGRGYEMFSTYKYYREYYFPVTPTDNTLVSVTRHDDDRNNSGWNIIVSPKMGKFIGKPKPEDITITVLQPDGGYIQEIPEVIMPAVPFSYQASATGMLNFESTLLFNASAPAPRRKAVAEETERIQWIHLDIADANGQGDQTSIYSHPTRYDAVYQTGIDVAKQSLTASRAIIYSSHAYGEMAFAGVADLLLEQGVALTVYSPIAQELTISMRENDWLNRMAYVWLVDHETGARTDLLWDTYTFDATEGTARGRFTIEGVFRAPQITTDIENAEMMNDEMMKVRKVLINQKMYILRGDQMYDATGKKVSK